MALENKIAAPEPIEGNQDLQEKLGKLDPANDNKTNIQLSVAEQKRWARGKTDRDQLLAEKAQLQKETEDRMRDLAGKKLLPAEQNADFLRNIDQLGPEKLRLLKAHLEDLAETEGEKSMELDPEDEKLLKIEDKFKKICRTQDNKKYLGDKDSISKHEQWFKQQRLSNPTVKHLEQCLDNFANNPNADGLKKREIFYNQKLLPKFKKYGFSSPLSSQYIRSAGLSKRTQFLDNAEAMEKHLQTTNSDLYSSQSIRNEMREILTEQDPDAQKVRIDKSKEATRIENENYTYIQAANNKVTIGKFTIPAMSARSMDFLIQSHKRESVGSEKRMQSAKFWPNSMRFLKGLAKQLEKTLEKHPELLEKAVGIFRDLSDDAKIDFLKQYEQLTESTANQEEIQSQAMIKSAVIEIDKAKRGKYISSKTAERFTANFAESHYKDSQTGRYDLPKLEERFKLLTSNRPISEQKNRNLAAYFKAQQEYLDDLEKIQELNPDMTSDDIRKLREDYEKSSWDKKGKKHRSLKEDIRKINGKKAAIEEISQELEVSKEPEGKESSESTLEWGLLLKQIASLEAQGQYGEITTILLFHYSNVMKDPDSSEKDEIMLWEKLTHYRNLSKQFGKGEKMEEDTMDQLEANMESLAENDQDLQADLEEQQVQTLGIELTEMSQRRFNDNVTARDRAKKESLGLTQDGSDAEKLTEDFYTIGENQGEQDSVLDKYGQAKEITSIELDKDTSTNKSDMSKLKQTIYRHQGKIGTKEGETSFEVEDGKTGKALRAADAKRRQETELVDLEAELSDKAIKQTEEQTGNVFDLNERIAAQRDTKARKIIDEKRFSKLRSAG